MGGTHEWKEIWEQPCIPGEAEEVGVPEKPERGTNQAMTVRTTAEGRLFPVTA